MIREYPQFFVDIHKLNEYFAVNKVKSPADVTSIYRAKSVHPKTNQPILKV